MGDQADQQTTGSHLEDGLRHLRAGKVKAALLSWEQALEADADNAKARSFIDYIKKNRIRVAVHLGRATAEENQAIEIPDNWPEPPAGLFDPIVVESAEDEAPEPAPEADLPYVEVELTGASRPRLSDVLQPPAQDETQRVDHRPDIKPAQDETQRVDHRPDIKPAQDETQRVDQGPDIVLKKADEPGEPDEPDEDATDASAEPDEDHDSDYLTMEITVGDDADDEPPAEADTLPPPPEALDAPELRLEAPPEENNEDEADQDYVVDRATSEAMEPLTLERLAPKSDSSSTPAPPPPPADAPPAVEEPSLPEFSLGVSDDEPTQHRERTPSGADSQPAGVASPEDAKTGPQSDAATAPSEPVTFDDAATNPRAAAEMMARHPLLGRGAPSPYSTLAGLGPRVLFADFKDSDLQGAPPPLDFRPPPAEQDEPTPGVSAPPADPADQPLRSDSQPREDYVREQGSFSEDAPTRALGSDAPERGLRLEDASDFSQEGSFSDDIPTTARPANRSTSKTPTALGGFGEPEDFRREGSFSDDIPTTARPASSQAIPQADGHAPASFGRESSFSDDLPTRARDSTVEAGPGSIDDLSDFIQEGSFSDDIPTRARPDQGGDRPLIRPMPLSDEFRRESSFRDDLVTQERKGDSQKIDKEERLSEELEAMLHPERGLALARRLCESGEFERSLVLTETLQGRYPDLDGLDELLEANRSVMETKLLDKLGELSCIAIPKADVGKLADMDLDPREAFLFSRIDGTMSVEDLIDISGMSRFETARILVHLREMRLLELKPGR